MQYTITPMAYKKPIKDGFIFFLILFFIFILLKTDRFDPFIMAPIGVGVN
jgi:hypothetical protein